MRYYGGKHRIGKEIAGYLESIRDGRDIVEPFCGALGVTRHLSGTVRASDSNPYLIDLFHRCQEEGMDWLPDTITCEEFYGIRALGDANPRGLLAFSEIGAGFGGRWRTGYARSQGRTEDFVGECKRGLSKKFSALSPGVTFSATGYSGLSPSRCLIYCDPPYLGTENGYLTKKFDSGEFWDKMREWAKTNTVVVSECQAPDDFEVVWEKAYTRGHTGYVVGKKTSNHRVAERMYRLRETTNA